MNSNLRHTLLSLSLLVGVAAPWAAIAQAPISNVGSGSIDDRVAQLERITGAQGDLLTQLQQQIAEQQRDIEYMRGQLQQSQHQFEQAQRQQQAAQVGEGEAANTENNTSTEGASNVPASSGDENTDYNAAVSLAIDKKQYDDAIVAFQNFVKQYPKSTFQPNANYWLGQLNYNKGKKDDAAAYFAYVVKNYPQSPKSPDAMFKVGLIMQDKGQKDKAKAVYQQIVKVYPKTEAAQLAQKRLAGL